MQTEVRFYWKTGWPPRRKTDDIIGKARVHEATCWFLDCLLVCSCDSGPINTKVACFVGKRDDVFLVHVCVSL